MIISYARIAIAINKNKSLCSGFAFIGRSEHKAYSGTKILNKYGFKFNYGFYGEANGERKTDCLNEPGLKNGLFKISKSKADY
jgi:hypothetical protein